MSDSNMRTGPCITKVVDEIIFVIFVDEAYLPRTFMFVKGS